VRASVFWKKKKDKRQYEDPATRYGKMLRGKNRQGESRKNQPSFLARLFSFGLDSDFVYHDD